MAARPPHEKIQGSGFRVQGSGFRVEDSGFRVHGPECMREWNNGEYSTVTQVKRGGTSALRCATLDFGLGGQCFLRAAKGIIRNTIPPQDIEAVSLTFCKNRSNPMHGQSHSWWTLIRMRFGHHPHMERTPLSYPPHPSSALHGPGSRAWSALSLLLSRSRSLSLYPPLSLPPSLSPPFTQDEGTSSPRIELYPNTQDCGSRKP